MAYSYKVKAVGYGANLLEYPLDFKVTSNYDIETNREGVLGKIRGKLQREWGTAYRLISVEKGNYILNL